MKPLRFETVGRIIAATFAALGVTLLVWPAVIHWLFQIPSDAATDVMSRRAAMLFAGLATLMWQARLAEDSALRRSVCLSVSVALAGLAIVGLAELLRGAVGAGIFLAIAVELAFVAALLPFWRTKAT